MPPDTTLTLQWNACGRDTWEGYLADAGQSSLEQSWSYGTALSEHYGQTTHRILIVQDKQPVGMAQLFEKKLLGRVSIYRIARGPLFLPNWTAPEEVAASLRAFASAFSIRRREFLFWLPELTDTPYNQALMRSLGTRRMVTGLSSAWLDLSRPEEVLEKGLSGSWRTALRKAERDAGHYDILSGDSGLDRDMSIYDKFRRTKRFAGPSGALVQAIAAADHTSEGVLCLTAARGEERIAGMVIIRHGRSATYYVSWTSDEGRALGAHNLLLWRGLQRLKEGGTNWLDLGGLNTGPGAGVARFKLGLGPEVFTLAGTYF